MPILVVEDEALIAAAYAGAAGVVLLASLYRVGAKRARRPAAVPAR